MTAHLIRSSDGSMSTSSGIRFKDPFRPVQYDKCHPSMTDFAAQSLTQQQQHRRLETPLTRTEANPASQHGYMPREQGTLYRNSIGERGQRRSVYKTAPLPVEHNSTIDLATAVKTSVPAMSPISNARSPDEDEQSQSRRESIVANIAPSFQIPRSVNDSGGSLSELAAEIACLFWFESSELLESIETSATTTLNVSRPLTVDARPTTGFLKWVTTILSTTLVAQNVVLLALLFVYRLKKLNPTVRGKPGSEYRLLTIALMLGNKFLDDNTYTNKTWAEVSGINVSEVHVMEVEFLSNMKYCLYTSADDWFKWQLLLGRFASYVDRAKNPPTTHLTSVSLTHPLALPSPPASIQASPPYVSETYTTTASMHHGPPLAPSPQVALPELHPNILGSRKRSLDRTAVEPPSKRSVPYSNGPSPRRATPSTHTFQPFSRLPPPNLAIATTNVPQQGSGPQGQQLPPIINGLHASSRVPPLHPSSNSAAIGTLPASLAAQLPTRQQSPYSNSRTTSPNSGLPRSVSLHPPIQVSPNYYLQQRSSPYRPVYNVSTLLYPPPSTAMQHKMQNVEQDQMHYQPLGKTVQHQQSGRLPYVAQNVWMDGQYPHAMTPVHQWSSFNQMIPQQMLPKQ